MANIKDSKYWAKYFRAEAVRDIQAFSDRSTRSIQYEYTKTLNKLQNRFDIKGLEKIAYQIVTEQKGYSKLSSEELEKAITNRKLSALANKYGRINQYLKSYNAGKITLSELNEKIKKYKETTTKYLVSYGKGRK